MTERRAFIIDKKAEPADYAGVAYAESLRRLPGEEEDLTPNIEGVALKLREMSPEEAEELRREVADGTRRHINAVTENGTAGVPPEPEVSADARRASVAEIHRYHGFDKAHGRGYKGKGQRIAINDTGLDETWASRLGSRLVAKESMVSGEDWRDTGSGHGTWCTGAVTESAPECEVVVIKVLSTKNGQGSWDNIIRGINRAVELGCTGVTQSLSGSGGPDNPVSRAVDAARAKGLNMPVAAGNEQRGTTEKTSESRQPASAKRAITCAAGDIDGNLADFSSWGENVDIRAVGVLADSWGKGGGRASMSGTSMSTPRVMAGVACIRSSVGGRPGANADEAEKALYATCGDTSLPAWQEGYGVMDVEFAVGKVAPGPAPSPPKAAYRVIAGTFSVLENAKKREKDIEAAGFPAFVEKKTA